MGVILATLGMLLSKLADLEFEVLGHLNMNLMRRMHLRFMRVAHGKHLHFRKDMIRNRGALSLGERCGIGSFARIWKYAPIDIVDGFLSAGGLTLNSGGHDPLTLESMRGPTKIGDRVWCGVKVTILGGSRLTTMWCLAPEVSWSKTYRQTALPWECRRKRSQA